MRTVLLFIVLTAVVIAILVVTGNYFGGHSISFPVGYRNNRVIVYKNFCTDLCPDYLTQLIRKEYWYRLYFDVRDEQECRVLRGEPVFVLWGYLGCRP